MIPMSPVAVATRVSHSFHADRLLGFRSRASSGQPPPRVKDASAAVTVVSNRTSNGTNAFAPSPSNTPHVAMQTGPSRSKTCVFTCARVFVMDGFFV